MVVFDRREKMLKTIKIRQKKASHATKMSHSCCYNEFINRTKLHCKKQKTRIASFETAQRANRISGDVKKFYLN